MKNTPQDKLSSKPPGFTIIEVLIVLAIAGLIMLVVFLAVPNLQRNNRNNMYRSEASAILAAYSEVLSNKNGASLSISNSNTSDSDAARVKEASNLQNITTIHIVGQTTGIPPSYTTAVIKLGARCQAPDNLTTPPASPRRIALLFVVESEGANVFALPPNTLGQCIST